MRSGNAHDNIRPVELSLNAAQALQRQRSRSRSRSRSPISDGASSDVLSGSNIMSPAAEFLGSFSQHARQRSGTGVSQVDNRPSVIRSDSTAPTHKSYASTSSHALTSFIAPDPDEEGEEIDGYVIERTLGQGTYSTVKQARHIESGRIVAVKIVRHAQFAEGGSSGSLAYNDYYSSAEDSRRVQRQNAGPSGMVAFPTDADRQADGRSRDLSRPAGPSKKTRRASSPTTTLRARSCSSPSVPLMPGFRSMMEQAMEAIPGSSTVSPTDCDNNDQLEPIEGVDFMSQPTSPVMARDSSEESSGTSGSGGISRADPALQKEIAIWQRLKPHPHIVPMIRFKETDFASFIFMPLCRTNLLEYVKQYGRGGPKSPLSQQQTLQDVSEQTENSSLRRSVSISSAVGSDDHPPNTTRPQRSTSVRIRRPGEIPPEGAGLPFADARKIFAQIVFGLIYLHEEAKVTHKDIKLENILLDQEGTFRISDFGLAHAEQAMASHGYASPKSASRRNQAYSDDGGVITSSIGIVASASMPDSGMPSLGEAASMLLHRREKEPSPPRNAGRRRSGRHAIPADMSHSASAASPTAGSLQYTSPEQIRSPAPVTEQYVDIWALGCVLYAMIAGHLPFDDGFEPRLRISIMKGEWKLPSVLESKSSDEDENVRQAISEVLHGCLAKDPKQRWTVHQVAQSTWLRGCIPTNSTPASPICGRPASTTPLATLRIDSDDKVSELKARHQSRGRPTVLRTESAPGSRPASARRGPSQDEYRRARGESPRSPSSRASRSRSRSRHFAADQNAWEVL